MKKFFIFIVFLLRVFNIFGEDDKEEKKDKENNKKYSDYFSLTLSSKTEVEMSIIDTSDDANEIDIGPDKNTPKIREEIYAFVRVNTFSNKKFILGPYVYSTFEVKVDRKKINTDYYFFFEEFNSISDLGIKIGFDFGSAFLKGSSLSFGIPISFKWDIFDKDSGRKIPDGIKNINFFSHFYIGINPTIELKLRSKQNFISFDVFNSTLFAPEVINTYYKSGFNFYILNTNKLKFSMAPFNYINERVDIWLTMYNNFKVYYDSYNLGLDERAYFNIVWKGLQKFELFYKPIIYNFSLKIPNGNLSLAYDQKNNISMEVGVSFNNKFVEFTLSYEPTLWAIDGANYNIDSVKPHTFQASLELKY